MRISGILALLLSLLAPAAFAATTYRISAEFPVIEADESEMWLGFSVIREGDIGAGSTVTARLDLGPVRTFAPITLHFRREQTERFGLFPIEDQYYSGQLFGELVIESNGTVVDRRPVRVRDNESMPVVSIDEFFVREPIGGDIAAATVPIRISPPTYFQIPLRVRTLDGTAHSPQDYAGRDETVIIPPRATTHAFPVDVKGDLQEEHDESLSVELVYFVNIDYARFGNRTAGGAILDFDRASPQVHAYDVRRPLDPNPRNIIVTLNRSASGPGTLTITSSNPDVISVPPAMPVAAHEGTFFIPVTAAGRGPATVWLQFPASAGGYTVALPFFVYADTRPHVLPERVVLEAGEYREIDLYGFGVRGDDAPIPATLAAADPEIVTVEPVAMIPSGNGVRIWVRGLEPGQTTITVTFPEEFGGTTLQVPVKVYDPWKRRVVR